MISFVTLKLYEKRLENSYVLTVFIAIMTRLIMGKYIVFGAYNEVEVQKFAKWMSAGVHVVQSNFDIYIHIIV